MPRASRSTVQSYSPGIRLTLGYWTVWQGAKLANGYPLPWAKNMQCEKVKKKKNKSQTLQVHIKEKADCYLFLHNNMFPVKMVGC